MFWLIDTVIIRPIMNILFLIYNFVGDFGLAIIIFTVLVKICMWPLVKKQLHQTKLMRKIQPELAEIKKRCKGNRQMESLQMMDLYKRNNVKPMSSVLTLFIQLPIFIALFSGIRAFSNPANPSPNGDTCGYTSVSNCAYEPIKNLSRIKEISEIQDKYLAEIGDNKTATPDASYDFHPKLFGLVELDASASQLTSGKVTVSTITIFLFAVAAALVQWLLSRQQLPSKKKKGRTFKEMIAQAKKGEDPDQADLSAMASRQMGNMMPIMMFIIMFGLPGALVFYYLLSNVITAIQQKIVLNRDEDEMEERADKAVLKELRDIKEAEVVENKGGKKEPNITRISAGKGNNKKRRKK
ncbi:YidC/Oxa1 family membrane protein insertase [Candidatus Saccharibacteria bacterium]|nr:YidC/Oxa1 family membrane protein insertase [Candidatus Saccharibacteria bacterium]